MDDDAAFEVEGRVVILSATTGSEDPFSVESESFATPPSGHHLLDPE
jgi:hypothetical protein